MDIGTQRRLDYATSLPLAPMRAATEALQPLSWHAPRRAHAAGGRRRGAQPRAVHSDGPASALDWSRKLAAQRAAESALPDRLVYDEYAASLAEKGGGGEVCSPPLPDARDLLAARFLDEQVLKAVGLANVARKQEYNQVVLVGDGMDTRPFRLPWPTGTVLYLVAPGEVHERVEAVLSEAQARVPRGCLLRRVAASLQPGASFAEALAAAGFRGDRLSVWALQRWRVPGLLGSLQAVLTDMSNLAAFDSVLAGELPPMRRRAAEDLLASYGFLGTTLDFAERAAEYGDARHASSQMGVEEEQRWLFICKQQRLSLDEINIYTSHVQVAEETDEDFMGNFS